MGYETPRFPRRTSSSSGSSRARWMKFNVQSTPYNTHRLPSKSFHLLAVAVHSVARAPWLDCKCVGLRKYLSAPPHRAPSKPGQLNSLATRHCAHCRRPQPASACVRHAADRALVSTLHPHAAAEPMPCAHPNGTSWNNAFAALRARVGVYLIECALHTLPKVLRGLPRPVMLCRRQTSVHST
eukprot:6196957-Pleurochrysis_carterae.AAC.1